MKITFLSNYLTPHQIPFCNEMYRLLGENFTFVATQAMEAFRLELGWEIGEAYPYLLDASKNEEAYQKALRLSKESDVIITGSAPEIFLSERLRNKNSGLTFRYSERIYKRGRWRALSPRGILLSWKKYHRYRRQPLYMLCASAYTYGDFILHGDYPGRCYRWGYFPETIHYDLNELMSLKRHEKTELLWCGRLIDLKHPEVIIKLASRLREENFRFHINIIGTGEQENNISEMIHSLHLEDFVTLTGFLPPKQVISYMEKAQIFIQTSNYSEGWGAVINEAMNGGCAVVVSHAAGAAPFLIKDGENGFLYKYGNEESLYRKTRLLLQDEELTKKLGIRAYHTITTEWNAKEAARRLLPLIEDLKHNHYSERFNQGPCSKAKILFNHWYRVKI